MNEAEVVKRKTLPTNWDVDAGQPSVILVVTPVFSFLRIIGMCPFRFKFNPKIGEFVHEPASKLRQAITLIIGVITLTQSYGLSRLSDGMAWSATLIIFTALEMGYVTVVISFYWAFLTKGHEIQEMLNLILQHTRTVKEEGPKFLNDRKARLLSAVLIAFAATVSLLLALGNLLRRINSASFQSLFEIFSAAANMGVRVFGAVLGYSVDLDQYDPPDWLTYSTGVLAMSLSWWSGMCWSGAILVSVTWATLFVLLLHQFFNSIRRHPPCHLLDIIGSYNDVVKIIDKYNSIYSWLTLTSVTTCCLYMSVVFGNALTRPQGKFGTGLLIGSLGWFSLQLVATAHVHHMATQIAEVIRETFHLNRVEKGYFKGDGDGSESNVATGVMLVLHDIQSGNIGFKGKGFFTCSYTLIASVIGIIGTYTMVMLQFGVSSPGSTSSI